MIFGLDLLGGARYKRVALAGLPAGWALGGFAETFGDFYSVADGALKRGCPHVRVHLLWSDSHFFGDADIPKIRRLSRKYNQLAHKYPAATIEISPFCEHNLSNPDKYLDIVQDEAPLCFPVNTPWRGKESQKYKNEHHGTEAKGGARYNFSFDGDDCTNADVEKLKQTHKNADVFFFWAPRFNLKWSMKDDTPRPKRTAKPSTEYVQSIVYLASDKGETDIPRDWLIKSHAEKHSASDTKGDKLLIIASQKADLIQLKRGKKVIDTLRYYGPFDGGGYRYYSTRFGFRSGANLEMWIKKKKYGVCNGGFRSAPYR